MMIPQVESEKERENDRKKRIFTYFVEMSRLPQAAEKIKKLSGGKSPDFFLDSGIYDKYNVLYKSYKSYQRSTKMNTPDGKYAWTATVGEKGQIVIPKQAREIFGINPGDTLILLGDAERGIAIPPKETFTEWFKVFSE